MELEFYRKRPTWADGNESRLQNLLRKQALRMTICQKDNHCCPLSKANQALHFQKRPPGFTIPKLSFESLQCRTLQDQNITNSMTMTNQDFFTTNMELQAPESSTVPCLDLICSRRTIKNVFKAQPRAEMEDEMENMCPTYLQTNSRQYTTMTEKRNEAITKMGSPATHQSACLDLVCSRVPTKKCFQAQPRMKMEVEIDNLCQTYLQTNSASYISDLSLSDDLNLSKAMQEARKGLRAKRTSIDPDETFLRHRAKSCYEQRSTGIMENLVQKMEDLEALKNNLFQCEYRHR